MLDSLLNSVRRSALKVQQRGEEMTQVARLKVEVFQLGRDLEGHFARLGRAYHSGADVDLLQRIRDDIRHTEHEIQGRERLIAELSEGEMGDEAQAPAEADQQSDAQAPTTQAAAQATAPQPLTSAAPVASNRPAFTETRPESAPDLSRAPDAPKTGE